MLNMSEIPYSVRGGRRGVASLDALSDTTITNLQDADVLSYDVTSNQWINSASTGATAVPLGSASDVNITNVVDKQALVYDSASSQWINSNDLTASNINLGTTGTITTNLVSGFPGMLLESSGLGVAPNWVTNISVNSIQYLASRSKTTATDDGINPAFIYSNPSATTGGKFEISTKTVGDSLPTIKLTVNNAGAIGIGNSLGYYDPATFAYAGVGPSYGAHGAILQSRGSNTEPRWLPKGSPGQYLTPVGGSVTDLTWTNLPSSGGLETITLKLNQNWTLSPYTYPWQAGSRLGPEMPSNPYDVVYPASGLPSWVVIGTDNLIQIQSAGYYKFEINQSTRWSGGLTFTRPQFFIIRNGYLLSNFANASQTGYDLVHAQTIAPHTPGAVNSGYVWGDWSYPEHHMFTVYMNSGDRMLQAHMRNVETGIVYGLHPGAPKDWNFQLSVTRLP